MLDILKLFGLRTSLLYIKYLRLRDSKRILQMMRKTSVEGKVNRKPNRTIRKGFRNRNDGEGDVYNLNAEHNTQSKSLFSIYITGVAMRFWL